MTKTAIISGVGSGLGAALVRRFVDHGYQVAMLARSTEFTEGLAAELNAEANRTIALAADVSDADQVASAFARVRDELGPVDVMINHAGNAVWKEFGELTPDEFERSWRVCAYGSMLCSQQAAADMLAAGSGSILFTGATSSIRGRAGALAFSSAKFAVRGLAWSLAREFWPRGIHVAHVIIDGVIDTPHLRSGGPVANDEPLLDAGALAEAYLELVRQDPGAWSFEIDLRPQGEGFFE